ncbi:MAG TPA: histidine kinase [Pseudonocardiaceae bacterium]|jgi:signal transduction histidine kinase
MRSGNPPASDVPPELAALWHSTFARRAVRLGRRLHRIDRAHPSALDRLLVLAILAAGLAELLVVADNGRISLLGTRVHVALIAVTVVGQALPLAWRRRAPLAVLTAILAACVLQWSLGISLHSAFGILISLYAVARYDRLTALPWVGACCVAGLGVAAFHARPYDQQSLDSMFFLCATATAAAALGLVVRVRRAQLDALADRAARLEVEREQRVQLATLAERSRVSREMHDIVGHNLAVIIGLADGAAAADPDARADVLRLIAGTGRQALSELRRTLGALRERPDQPVESAELSPQPGITDLPALLDRIRAAGPRICYRTEGDLDTVPASVQLAAYRIIQEALTNSLKHAGSATTLRVTLSATDREFGVSVQDSGQPVGHHGRETIYHATGTHQSGQGLIGIRERAALTGGTAYAGPDLDGGWIVRATLPLPPQPVRSESPALRESSR